MTENEIGRIIVDATVAVHRELGPGLLESVYEAALSHELEGRALYVERQVPIRVKYKDICLEEAFRADLIVEHVVIVEIKSVEALSNAHKKQTLTYLKLSGIRLGFLINFGEALVRDGIVRMVNGLQEEASTLAPFAPSREAHHE